MRKRILLSTVVLATACSYQPPQVPVMGTRGELDRLAGEWYGSYESAESGRSGSILFRLQAGADSAFGDVLMVPRHASPPEMGMARPSELIPIRFVSVQAGGVRGVLEGYRDPVCGCHLETVFSGVLDGDTITGTFESRHLEGGSIQRGRWRVVRQPVGVTGGLAKELQGGAR